MANDSTSIDCSRRVLIVEDEERLAKNLAIFLDLAGAQVYVALSGEDALAEAEAFNPHCLLVDYNLPGMNGLETISRIRETHPGALFVLMSAQASGEVRAAARDQGVHHILSKPFPLSELRVCLGGEVWGNHRQPAMAEG